jgi:predicted permease
MSFDCGVEEKLGAASKEPSEAHFEALRQFGNATSLKERTRGMWTFSWLEDFWQDIRFGARMLRKSPGFTAVALLTLALGIGASTSVFSVIDAVLLRAAPYKDANQLILLWTPIPRYFSMVASALTPEQQRLAFEVFNPSNGDFYDIQAQGHFFTKLALFNAEQLNVSSGATTMRSAAAKVTGDFFSVLMVAPEIGRAIEPQDDSPAAERVALISHALWVSDFGAARDVLGKILLLDSQAYRIVGVMPRDFGFPRKEDVSFDTQNSSKPTELWIPFAMDTKQKADYENSPGFAIARLRPGVSMQQAEAEMAAILARTNAQHPPEVRDSQAVITPLASTMNAQPRRPLLFLLAAVAVVLLIACSNSAGLLMARGAGRLHEMRVRSALGARRSRLVRQLLAESLLIGFAACALGLFAAYAAIRGLVRLNPGHLPRFEETSLNSTALLFAFGLTLLTSLLFGMAPALSVSHTKLGEMIKQSAGRNVRGAAGRFHEALIVIEVGLSVLLLAGSGLFIRSLIKLNAVDKGFQPHAILTASISLDHRYDQREKQIGFFREAIQKITQLPEVRAASVVNYLALAGGESISTYQVEGHAFDRNASFETRTVTPGYFAAMGVPLLEGRTFSDDDAVGHPAVAIVNRTFARTYFRGETAIGKHYYPMADDGKVRTNAPVTIVGVVADVRQWDIEKAPSIQSYSPLWQIPYQSASIVVRTTTEPSVLVPQIRAAVRSIDPTVAVADVRTMDDLVTEAAAGRRFQTLVLSAFAGIALFLSLVGLYALMAYSVKQRTPEIGIRMALGADRRNILQMILRHGVKLTIVGALIGLAGGLAASRVVARFLFGVRPLDPPTMAAAIVLLLLVALIACYLPARRAAGVDPMVALRHD